MSGYSILLVVSMMLSVLNAQATELTPKQVIAEEEQPVKLLFTGDVLFDRGVKTQIHLHSPAWLFEGVDSLFHTENGVIVNLECPLTDTLSPVNKKYIFSAPTSMAKAMSKAGINIACLANNHTMDQGRQGLISTYNALNNEGIITLGFEYPGKEIRTTPRGNRHEASIKFFNSCIVTVENWFHSDTKPDICQMSVDSLCTEITKWKQKYPEDVVIVVLHWGIEFRKNPEMIQREQAEKLIDAGADAIIGHHPHVIQPHTTIKGKPVFYSLGNFIFDQKRQDGKKCQAVELQIYKNGEIKTKVYDFDIVNTRPILSK